MSDNDLQHPVFYEGADQHEMITAILDAFPGVEGAPDVQVPIPSIKIRQAWAKQLIKRGLVLVPELMRELPVAISGHPEASWLQPMTWVSREDYAEQCATYEAEAPASTPEQQRTQAEQMLRAIKPSLADRIAAMSDVEKRAELAKMATEIPQHIDAVQAALDQLEQARAKEATDG